jgi:hypothetical protein
MRQFIRRHLETIIVAMVVSAIFAGGPAIAHGVRHALFSHKAGVAKVAKNAKAFGGKSPSTFETLASRADTGIATTMDHTSRAAGEEAEQTLTVSNAGPGRATGVDVSVNKMGWTPSTAHPNCVVQLGGVTCTNLSLAKGSTLQIHIDWTAGCSPTGFDMPMLVTMTSWKYDKTPSNNNVQQSANTIGCPPPGP